MSFVIGIEKMIEVTLGIPLQGKIKAYPEKKESLNDQSHRVTRLLYTSGGVGLDIQLVCLIKVIQSSGKSPNVFNTKKYLKLWKKP